MGSAAVVPSGQSVAHPRLVAPSMIKASQRARNRWSWSLRMCALVLDKSARLLVLMASLAAELSMALALLSARLIQTTSAAVVPSGQSVAHPRLVALLMIKASQHARNLLISPSDSSDGMYCPKKQKKMRVS